MQNEMQKKISNEISLKEIFSFLQSNQRLIVIMSVIGLLFSISYLVFAPKKYEARLQIKMAQFVNGSNVSLSNIEEPAALIQRLRGPTIYPADVLQSCGIAESAEFGDYLGGVIKAEVVPNLASVISIKIIKSNPDDAKKCAEGLVSMIVFQQRDLIVDRLAGREDQLLKYKKLLQEEQQLLIKITESGPLRLSSLARLDKFIFLNSRIDALQEEVLLSKLHSAKLIAPIYSPSKSISPNVGLVLMFGFTLGLMSALLYSLWGIIWRSVV